MKKKKKWLYISIAIVIILIVMTKIGSRNNGIHIVTIEKAEKRELIERVTANGEIKPKKNINISTDVAGKILKLFVMEGDPVSKGQMLLKINSDIYESNAERDRQIISSAQADSISQEANLKKASQFFKRRKQLYDEGLLSLEQFEDARVQLEVAEATKQNLFHRIEQAKASLKSSMDTINKTSIISPIDGIVTSLRVEEGEVAIIGTMNNPGTILMTIADLSVMEAEVQVDETDIVKVKLNKKSEVKVDALPDTLMAGLVTEIGNSAIVPTTGSTTTESRDFKAIITLTDPPKTLKPGFTATADIIIEQKKNCLSIPIAALVLQEEEKKASEKKEPKEGVYIMENGKAVFREVKKGIPGDMYIEILSGLVEKDEVITGPFTTLKKIKNNERVKVQKEEKK